MDSKKQHDTAKETRKLKNTFSVPIKKSDTCTRETKNWSKAGHKSTCPENRVHISSQSDDKKNKERMKQTGKKTPKPTTENNLFCGDKLHSTKWNDDSASISSESGSISNDSGSISSESGSISSDSGSISSDSGSISKTIAEVIGRTKHKSENASDDSASLDENDAKQKNAIANDDSESLYEKDIDNWNLEKTDVCEESSRGKHSEKKKPCSVKSKKQSQDESDAGITGTPKSPQLIDNVSTELSPGNTDCTSNNVPQEETGTWVQCGIKKCNKWRYLADVEDPVVVPEIWECSMNSDKEYNSCDKPQMKYQEAEHIYTKYTIGSCVWAKLEGYPWWPAMIECDPDDDVYYQVSPQAPMVPLHYHVTFFDDNVSRSWVRSRCIIPYKGQLPKAKISDCYLTNKKDIEAAMKNADKALPMRLKFFNSYNVAKNGVYHFLYVDRVEMFGFKKRFSPKGVSKIRSSKLCGSTGNIFLKSESLSYTRGVHKSPSLEGSGPLKNISKSRPLETKIIKDQTGKSKVNTAKSIQSSTESTSKTHGAPYPNKLSKSTSGLLNSNIRTGGKHWNSDDKENNVTSLLDKADNKLLNKKRKHPKEKLSGTDDGHKHNKKFILKESDTNSITDDKEKNMPALLDKAEKKVPGTEHGYKHNKKFILKEVGTNSITDDKEKSMPDLLNKAEKLVPNKKRKHQNQKLPFTDDGHEQNKKFILKESDTNKITDEKEKKMPGLLDKAEKKVPGTDQGHKQNNKFILKESVTNIITDDKEKKMPGLLDKAEEKVPNKKRKHPNQKLSVTDDGHKQNKKFILKESDTNSITDEKEKKMPALLDKAEKKVPGTDDGHKQNKKFILKDSDTNSITDDKENNMPGLLDKAEKKVPNKKRKHQNQKLPVTDDGHKQNKKFILKESDTKSITDDKENNMPGLLDKAEKKVPGTDHGHKQNKKFILKESTNSMTREKENKTTNNSFAVDSSGTGEKYSPHDQLHSIDRHEVVKKCKLTDNKEKQSRKHETGGQDSLKHDLPAQKAKTKQISSQIKQNYKNESFSVTVKGSPSRTKHEKVRKIKQEAVNKLSSKNEKGNNDTVDKLSVTVHSKAAVVIKKKKAESSSDDDKGTKFSNNVENRVQMSPLCIKCQKEKGESQEEYTNPGNENIVDKAASPADINDDSESITVSKTGKKEKTGANDLDQRKRDRKSTNIVTETKAVYNINKLNPASGAAFTGINELCAADRPGLADRRTVVNDQQVVPDMGTEMLTDSTSCTDLVFSNLPEKRVKSEITDHLLVKTLPDSSCEDEKDWGFDSVKLEENCPQKILNDEDSLDDNDEMMLDLDENIGAAALAETNKGYPLHDHFSRDSFFEFESAGNVDFSDD